MHCVSSPGEWAVPLGERLGWSCLPPQGGFVRPRWVPAWVRVWHMLTPSGIMTTLITHRQLAEHIVADAGERG